MSSPSNWLGACFGWYVPGTTGLVAYPRRDVFFWFLFDFNPDKYHPVNYYGW